MQNFEFMLIIIYIYLLFRLVKCVFELKRYKKLKDKNLLDRLDKYVADRKQFPSWFLFKVLIMIKKCFAL